MKKNVFFLLLTLVTISLYAAGPGGDRVDPLIEARFQKEFGPSVKASWEIIQDVSIATYTEQGNEKQVYYYSDGEIFGFGTVINKDLLPEAARKTIKEKFSAGVIQTVYEFKSKSTTTYYFVRVVTPRYSMIVTANDFGDVEVKQKIRSKVFTQ